MTLQEIMERVGSRKVGLVRLYAEDALQEIQEYTGAFSTFISVNVTSGQRRYPLPDGIIKVEGVYKRFTTSTDPDSYVRIPRIRDIQVLEST